MLILTLLVIPTLGQLELGSLNGYYTLKEIGEAIMNITNSYPGIASKTAGSYFQELSITNKSANSDYKKSLFLITGGLYSGNPMTSTVVLYLANKLASQYKLGNSTIISLLNNNQLLFLPVLNTPAYSYMENDFNGTFITLKTGLEGNPDCEGVDVGINPDRNFPYYWMNSTLTCQNDYPGSYPLESNISKYLNNYLNTTYRPSILFSFHEEGNIIYEPYTWGFKYLRLRDYSFYGNVNRNFLPDGYKFGNKYYNTGIHEYGNLIDNAYEFYTLSFQIQLNSTLIKSEIFAYADLYYDLLVNSILQANPDPSIVYKGLTEDVCNNKNKTCAFYSWLRFLFDIENYNAISFYYHFTFIPNFDNSSNYRILYVRLLEFGVREAGVIPYDANFTSKPGYNDINLKTFTSMYTHTNVEIVYVKFNYTDKEDNKGTAYLSSSVGSYYMTPKKISISSELEQKSNENINSEDDDKPNIMIIALTSSLGLLLLLFLAGLWLYCRKKHKKPEKNISTDHNLVLGENPRI